MQHTTAVLLPTFAPPKDGQARLLPTTKRRYDNVWQEAELWQRKSSDASTAEMIAIVATGDLPMRIRMRHDGHETAVHPGEGAAPRIPNSISEIFGLMGAIGEQLGLAWTAEQDLQRLRAAPYDDDEAGAATKMHGRALAEMSSHFLLAASNSLGNLVLRVLRLDEACAQIWESFWRKPGSVPGLVPGSEARNDWRFFDQDLMDRLDTMSQASASGACRELTTVLRDYHDDNPYQQLNRRRGLDYHRLRPQSVPNTAVRGGTHKRNASGFEFALASPQPDAGADLAMIHAIVTAAERSLASTMEQIRVLIPEAVRDQRIAYPFE